MTQVRTQDLTKKFGNVTALDATSLTFPDTKLTVLVGPSGCGKTTLLRIIAGLQELTAGSVYIGDKVVDDIPSWERNIAMVFQSYALYPHMTVYRNMAFPLAARKVAKAEIKERVERTAKMLGIDELLERRPRELSGGQMQRVAIGRAIVRSPEVFLMDEPLSNLDAKLRVNMRADLKKLQKDLGVTTIYVTHDQAEAMTMADVLVVMKEGRVQQIGEAEEVYRHPQNAFVAGFIGSPAMNMVPCRLDLEEGKPVTTTFKYPVPPGLLGSVSVEACDDLVLGVRPEDIVVQADKASGGIPCNVYMTEPLGKEVLVTLQVCDVMLKAFVPARLRPEIDERFYMTFEEDAIHLFYAHSGKAVA